MAWCPTTDAQPVQPGIDATLLARLIPCDERALGLLVADFEANKPASIVVGPGRTRTRKVVESFLATRSEQTCRVRIAGGCDDPEACLRAIIEGIGFATRGLNERDLDSIFRMFLSFQKSHRQRTVICFENAEQCAPRALGKIFEFIDCEAEEAFGLFVVLAGHEELDRRLQQGALRAIAGHAGAPIPVAPLARTETRDFVLDSIEAQDFDDPTIVIEPEAIARMHELSGGICDTVNGICSRCLDLAAGESCYPITTGLIDRAAVELGILHAEIEAVPCARVAVDAGKTRAGKLKLYRRGHLYAEYALDRDVVRIGRQKRNDLCLPSLLVSRYHALLTIGEGGVTIVDLGSSNGTIVNGNPVKSRVLTNGDTVHFGDYKVEYVAVDDAANALVVAEIMALDEPAELSEPSVPAVRVRRARA